MGTFKRIWTTKTFWVGLATIVYGAIGFITGTLDADAAIKSVLLGVAIITGRDAIEKK